MSSLFCWEKSDYQLTSAGVCQDQGEVDSSGGFYNSLLDTVDLRTVGQCEGMDFRALWLRTLPPRYRVDADMVSIH